MRPELLEMVLKDWLNVPDPFYQRHLDEIRSLEPTPQEKAELAAMLDERQVQHVVGTLTGIMSQDPDPIYVPFLMRGLESGDAYKAMVCADALLDGHYPDALAGIFRSAGALEAIGDGLPDRIIAVCSELTEPMQRQVLDIFCLKFQITPPLDWNAAPWFRLLASLRVTSSTVASTLMRIWDEIRASDTHNRYLLLRAMAANPHPLYKPVFSKMIRSTVSDLAGLARLRRGRGGHGLRSV
jgi:hypothetical protein